MKSDSEAREVRAGRNQSLFRAVNERLKDMNDAFAQITDSYEVACECADVTCFETLLIGPEEYGQVRAHPRQFVVRPGRVALDVEHVMREGGGYAVVEKIGTAGEVAEAASVRS